MYIQQLYTNCLAQASYYIESDGQAAVIDPLRDPQPYLELAKMRNAHIKFVFETHFHADFVSGHIDLAKAAGATIVYGPGARPAYDAIIALDHEKFHLGKLWIEVLHTPGHTIESSCFLLYDEHGKENSVFTGDTLFIGDVGRPDLMSGNLSKEELASMLYDSLEKKIKILPDEVLVYPGHGAGSACGKNIGKETSSTIGAQKKLNYAMANISREEFIRAVTSDLPAPPAYFFKDAAINIQGYSSYEEVFTKASRALDVPTFQKKMAQGARVLDARDAAHFEKSFIPGSVNIGLNGDFAVWVGTVIPFNAPLILVTEPGKENETITRLLRVGYENILGYLSRGMRSWADAHLQTEHVTTLKAAEAEDYIASDNYVVIDVRRPTESAKHRIKGSVLIPLSELPFRAHKLDPALKYLVYCAGGYRSMIAVSILKAAGINSVYNIEGGINKIRVEKPELVIE